MVEQTRSVAVDGLPLDDSMGGLPAPLRSAVQHAAQYLSMLDERPVHRNTSARQLSEQITSLLPEVGPDPDVVIDELAVQVDPGLVASTGGRYHGFVVGGALPVAMAADWLTTVWDQNACFFAASPAAAVVEETAARWTMDLLGLPRRASFGLTTGAQAANVIGLSAAMHHQLGQLGWDLRRDGLRRAPELALVAGAGRHVSIDRAARPLGLGETSLAFVSVDEQGAMRPEALHAELRRHPRGGSIVCAQAGNVNTGAIDPLAAIADIAAEHGAWLHVDGAFGMWAATSRRLRPLVAGLERADSWSVDAHKWLNVPYDSAFVFVAHPEAHRAATGISASYLPKDQGRDPSEWVLEFSRRARGFAVYTALRSLGRRGVADLVDQCCAHAALLADGLRSIDGVEVLNQVCLNQVLWRLENDQATVRALELIQSSGETWMGPTRWQDRPAIRLSVSGWATTKADVQRTIAAVTDAAHRAAAAVDLVPAPGAETP